MTPDPLEDFDVQVCQLLEGLAQAVPLIRLSALSLSREYDAAVARVAGSPLSPTEKARQIDELRWGLLRSLRAHAARSRYQSADAAKAAAKAAAKGGGPC